MKSMESYSQEINDAITLGEESSGLIDQIFPVGNEKIDHTLENEDLEWPDDKILQDGDEFVQELENEVSQTNDANDCELNEITGDEEFDQKLENQDSQTICNDFMEIKTTTAPKRQRRKKGTTEDCNWSPVLKTAGDLEMYITMNKNTLNKSKIRSIPNLDEASEHLTTNEVVHEAVLFKELAKGGIRLYFRFDDSENKIKAHMVLTKFYNDKYGINIGELKGGEGDRYRLLSSKLVKVRELVESCGNSHSNTFNLLYQLSRTLGLGTDSPSRTSMIQDHLRKLGVSIVKNDNESKETTESKNIFQDVDESEETIALRNNTNIVNKDHYDTFVEILSTALEKSGQQMFSETQKINFKNWQDMITSIFNPNFVRIKRIKKPKNGLSRQPRERGRRPYDDRPVHAPHPRHNEYAEYGRWSPYGNWDHPPWRGDWRDGPASHQGWGYAPHYWRGGNVRSRRGQRPPWRH